MAISLQISSLWFFEADLPCLALCGGKFGEELGKLAEPEGICGSKGVQGEIMESERLWGDLGEPKESPGVSHRAKDCDCDIAISKFVSNLNKETALRAQSRTNIWNAIATASGNASYVWHDVPLHMCPTKQLTTTSFNFRLQRLVLPDIWNRDCDLRAPRR